MQITEEEYKQTIKELQERDFDLFHFSFKDNFLTKENVEKILESPDEESAQYNYNVGLMAGDLKQIIARIRRKKVTTEQKRSRPRMIKLCFFIAVIIFVTSVCSDFSVRMFYIFKDPTWQIISGLIGIGVVTLTLWFFLKIVPPIKDAVYRMFGLKE